MDVVVVPGIDAAAVAVAAYLEDGPHQAIEPDRTQDGGDDPLFGNGDARR